jgi:hypothetical protein
MHSKFNKITHHTATLKPKCNSLEAKLRDINQRPQPQPRQQYSKTQTYHDTKYMAGGSRSSLIKSENFKNVPMAVTPPCDPLIARDCIVDVRGPLSIFVVSSPL